MATSSSSIFDHVICSSAGKNHQDRYDQASSLVAELNKPAPKTAESPLILPGISAVYFILKLFKHFQIDYMKLFDEQIAIEEGCFTKVSANLHIISHITRLPTPHGKVNWNRWNNCWTNGNGSTTLRRI
jgi:hypothetical protein